MTDEQEKINVYECPFYRQDILSWCKHYPKGCNGCEYLIKVGEEILMTDKRIKIEYEPYDKYEGWSVRPAIVATGMQANIGDELKIRCIKYRSQLKNKLHLDKIIEVLRKENLL